MSPKTQIEAELHRKRFMMAREFAAISTIALSVQNAILIAYGLGYEPVVAFVDAFTAVVTAGLGPFLPVFAVLLLANALYIAGIMFRERIADNISE